MKRPSNLSLAIAAGVILLASVFVFKRYLPYTGMQLSPQNPPSAVLVMDNAYLVGLGRSGKLWSIRAKSVELAQNRAIVTLNGIHDGKIYDRGKVALKVQAGKAAYNIFAKDLQLSQGIAIRGNEGQRISGPGANWNSFTGTLRSTGGVLFESGWGSMTAKTLVVDVRKREMRMWDGVMRVSTGAAGLTAEEVRRAN